MNDTDSSESLTDETENDADEEWEKEKSDDDESVKNQNVGGVSDSELSDKDFWHCTQCNAKTNSPYLRYCLRCFRVSISVLRSSRYFTCWQLAYFLL